MEAITKSETMVQEGHFLPSLRTILSLDSSDKEKASAFSETALDACWQRGGVCSRLPPLAGAPGAKASLPAAGLVLQQLQVGRAAGCGHGKADAVPASSGLSVFHYSSLCLFCSLGCPR